MFVIPWDSSDFFEFFPKFLIPIPNFLDPSGKSWMRLVLKIISEFGCSGSSWSLSFHPPTFHSSPTCGWGCSCNSYISGATFNLRRGWFYTVKLEKTDSGRHYVSIKSLGWSSGLERRFLYDYWGRRWRLKYARKVFSRTFTVQCQCSWIGLC